MRLAEPGMSEATLAAHFEYICAREGAQRPAYVPVVASGYVKPDLWQSRRYRVRAHSILRENALIIHYTQNDHLLRDRELVLVDAGCEYQYADLPHFTAPTSLIRIRYFLQWLCIGHKSVVIFHNQVQPLDLQSASTNLARQWDLHSCPT